MPKLKNDTFLAIYIDCYIITDLDSSSGTCILWKYENALWQYVMGLLMVVDTNNLEE